MNVQHHVENGISCNSLLGAKLRGEGWQRFPTEQRSAQGRKSRSLSPG